MSNLTISVDEELIKRARVRAIQQGTSLSAKVREFLAQYANSGVQAVPSKPVNLPIFQGGGLLPSIDPCSNKSMLDAADGFVGGGPVTPDVNVLIAAYGVEHPHHRTARDWLQDACTQSATTGGLRLITHVMASFLRLVTNPRVFATPAPIEQAIAFLDALVASPGVTVLDAPTPWPALRQLCLEKNLSANAIPDAMIAAAVVQSKEVLATFNRDFLRLLSAHQLQLLVN